MITQLNETRHRLSFRLWCAWLALQLRRRGATLTVDAPHGARLDSWPHVAVTPDLRSFTLRLGHGVKLGRATHIDLLGGDTTLALGDGSYLMHGVRLQLRGGAIRLAEHVDVRDGAVLKSEGELIVGARIPISYGTTIHCVERIEIGADSGLAERVTIVDSDHGADGTDTPFLSQPLHIAPVLVGTNVFVCANAVILRGARIGANSVVAAGAVAGAGEHPAGHLHAGAPARAIRLAGPRPPA